MKITILGVKGEIEESKPEHEKQSGILLDNLLIDLGEFHNIEELDFDFLIISHGHDDHIKGLAGKTIEVPVFSNYKTKLFLDKQETIIKDWRKIKHGSTFQINGFRIKAFETIHSIKAPGLAFKIKHSDGNLGVTSDIITIEDRREFLKNLDVIIADGSFMLKGIVRRKDGKIYGHCSLRDIFRWCFNFKVPQVIVQHYGAWYMKKFDEEKLKEIEKGLKVFYAKDGSTYILERGILTEVKQ